MFFSMNEDRWFEERLLKRFLEYVRIDTTSDGHSKKRPTTAGQLQLSRLLAQELKDLDVKGVTLDEQGFLFASLESNLPDHQAEPPEIGYIAHVDTSDAVPGGGIDPQVHECYSGEILCLKDGVVLDPAEFPELLRYKGQTLISSDGRTLLGADDKAGIAEIMVALEYLQSHPEIPHGRLTVLFTPDEEQGLSMERFPIDKLSARYCYTFDGGEEGTIEAECFEAYKVKLVFHGNSIHTGVARGKLVNAVEMAAHFVSMLPGTESPQATDGRYGFYFPLEINGRVESTELEIYLRDFEETGIKRRIEAVKQFARAVEAAFPQGRVEIEVKKQYANMARYLREARQVLELLEGAVRATGIEAEYRIIRGGTDGARLTEMGIPTPNIFTGGHNFHSRQEWVALPAMVRAARTAVNLVRLWAEVGSGKKE